MAMVNQILHRKNSSGTYDTVYLQVNLANVTGVLSPEHGGTGASEITDVTPIEITPESIGAISEDEKGAVNGVASLGSDGKVPSAQLPVTSSAEIFSKILTTSDWTLDSDGRYKQDVSVTGVTTNTKIITVDVDLTTSDMDAKVAYLTAWAGPSANEVTQGSGTLTFYSYELPTVAIPIFVGVCN